MLDAFENLRVVLVATRNPLNLGAAARAMSNFGFAHLRVVNPYDVAFREARSAVGAQRCWPTRKSTRALPTPSPTAHSWWGPPPCVTANCNIRCDAWNMARASFVSSSPVAEGRVALLFGSEKVGLSNEDLSHCHWLMRIPTREEHISMNLGQAVAVCLYELARDAKAPRSSEKTQRATADEAERITAALLDALTRQRLRESECTRARPGKNCVVSSAAST